ncbi:MAG: gene transfer agent family protein [Pseudomonadota bacterium]
MANPYRGEVALTIEGQSHVMRLTLGALCALEQELEDRSIAALVARFESGEIRMREVLSVLQAGLRGGGAALTEAELETLQIDGGAGAAMRLAAQLLRVAFAPPEDAPLG